MRCPKCGCQEDKVIDSRASREGATIRRRRECAACNYRFTTYEEVEHEGLMVSKRDGRHEEFSREKLLSGIRKACQKRPVSPKAMEDLVDHIMATVTTKFETEVPGDYIGTMVMDGLGKLIQWLMCGSPACTGDFRRPRISCRRSANWRLPNDCTA